ncbi:hypothetical protein [Paenibacillus ehimensis]|uniref:Uncharacterized protein n=2 Tax=Paenibacillus ehimensis TaxID=79264 RepID=A0ABT8VGJ9_9BACL|nr:hypothetical protein [Paenibacillus ehimensis]MDO3680106.1 hypothetical protein [Paenibacillus ehimensis]MEC0212132.1 hypothetical protein [Paenibacillus ehimensis]
MTPFLVMPSHATMEEALIVVDKLGRPGDRGIEHTVPALRAFDFHVQLVQAVHK